MGHAMADGNYADALIRHEQLAVRPGSQSGERTCEPVDTGVAAGHRS
jgi:hypothetical protein